MSTKIYEILKNKLPVTYLKNIEACKQKIWNMIFKLNNPIFKQSNYVFDYVTSTDCYSVSIN